MNPIPPKTSLLLKTLNQNKDTKLISSPQRPPLWMMRQAGRYLPEYKSLRAKAGNFWTLCFTPDYASEVTLQPIRRFNYDAAIIFSDILVIPKALGQQIDFLPDHGPKLEALDWTKFISQPINFEKLHLELNPIYLALQQTKKGLSNDCALIGFSGTPWTLATYMLDLGKGKGIHKEFGQSKRALQNLPFLEQILSLLCESISSYLIEKIKHGADVIQLFDSWAGVVPLSLQQAVLFDPLKKIIQNIRIFHPTTPIIYFGRGISESYPQLLDDLEEMGSLYSQNFALGIDQMTDIGWVKENLQNRVCVQGNLDPECLKLGGKNLTQAVDEILETLSNGSHIFNLGHGILPDTPIAHVEQVISQVRSHGK